MDFETLEKRLLARVRSRVRNGDLTERSLARRIGISQPHMNHILKGIRALTVEKADTILNVFEISVFDLMNGVGRPGSGSELRAATESARTWYGPDLLPETDFDDWVCPQFGAQDPETQTVA